MWPGQSLLENAVQPNPYFTFNSAPIPQVPVPVSTATLSQTIDLPSGAEAGPLDERDPSGKTALHHAVIRGSMEDVEKLLSLGLSVNDCDNDAYQPLHHAASRGFAGIIQLLLKNGANVNAKGPGGKTPVHLASRFMDAIRSLLKAHPTLSSQDDDGNTALHVVFRIAKLDSPPLYAVTKRLLDAGADVTISNHAGITPFHMAIDPPDSNAKPNLDIVGLFLHRIADLSRVTDTSGDLLKRFLDRTEIAYNRKGTTTVNSICKLMIRTGANPNIRLKSGEFLLHTALLKYRWDVELVELLCEKADVGVIANDGATSLHSGVKGASMWNHASTKHLGILLRRGAAPNLMNNAGDTPLTIALKIKSYNSLSYTTALISTLLDGGANSMLIDKAGDIPIYVAFRHNKECKALIQLLVDDIAEHESFGRLGFEASDELEWWTGYHYLLRSGSAHFISLQQLADAPGLPSDIKTPLSKTLLTAAAEIILPQLKARFRDCGGSLGLIYEETKMVRDRIVQYLRECKQLDLNIDPKLVPLPSGTFPMMYTTAVEFHGLVCPD